MQRPIHDRQTKGQRGPIAFPDDIALVCGLKVGCVQKEGPAPFDVYPRFTVFIGEDQSADHFAVVSKNGDLPVCHRHAVAQQPDRYSLGALCVGILHCDQLQRGADGGVIVFGRHRANLNQRLGISTIGFRKSALW